MTNTTSLSKGMGLLLAGVLATSATAALAQNQNMDQFRADDSACQQVALSEVPQQAGDDNTAGNRSYQAAYSRCMTSKGEVGPDAGRVPYTATNATSDPNNEAQDSANAGGPPPGYDQAAYYYAPYPYGYAPYPYGYSPYPYYGYLVGWGYGGWGWGWGGRGYGWGWGGRGWDGRGWDGRGWDGHGWDGRGGYSGGYGRGGTSGGSAGHSGGSGGGGHR